MAGRGHPVGFTLDDGILVIHRDTGCSLAPRCLECPLPACRYEVSPGVARADGDAKRLADMILAGKTVVECYEAMGISRRSAYRLIGRARRLGLLPPVRQRAVSWRRT